MKKFISISKTLTIFILFFLSHNVNSQGRSFIKSKINEYNECRNVAITKTNGDVMLYGKNGYAADKCPLALTDAIDDLNSKNVYIDDIQLTEEGSWVVLYGNNGLRWDGIPYSLEKKLRECNSQNEIITSITFNDLGDWIVITTNFYVSSDARITEWLKEGADKYGQLWAACITSDAMVAVFEGGYKFFGEVPQSLREALSTTKLNVYRIKIAGDSWFIADQDGRFNYYM